MRYNNAWCVKWGNSKWTQTAFLKVKGNHKYLMSLKGRLIFFSQSNLKIIDLEYYPVTSEVVKCLLVTLEMHECNVLKEQLLRPHCT